MMKKFFIFLLLITAICNKKANAVVGDSSLTDIVNETWKEFRQVHPYSYQTVGIKHVDSTSCILVISEPAPEVSEKEISELFRKYKGQCKVKQHQLGHDGWTKDVVGYVKSNEKFPNENFTDSLFNLLYRTDYKPYYTDLDHLSEHAHFVPYEYRLNHSWSTMDLIQMFNYSIDFNTKEGLCDIKQLLKSYNPIFGDCIFESCDNGFIVWLIDESILTDDYPIGLEDIIHNHFRASARRFALDTDMIIGAFGDTTGTLAIIGREREIPVNICPPLRAETILLMAQTSILELGQAFVPDSNSIDDKARHSSAIVMTEQIKDTEFGDLLIRTDQMLKSWTENNYNQDCHYNLPEPAYFPFKEGLKNKLKCSSIECGWKADNLDSFFQEYDSTTIFSVNQSVSLPVRLFAEGITADEVSDAEIVANYYFSSLNQPELFRTTQYTILCQIFNAHWWGIHVNDTTSKFIDDMFGQEMATDTPKNHSLWLKTPSKTCSNEQWDFGGFGRLVAKGVNSSIRHSKIRRASRFGRALNELAKKSKFYKGTSFATSGATRNKNVSKNNSINSNHGLYARTGLNNPIGTYIDRMFTYKPPVKTHNPPITNELGTTLGKDAATVFYIEGVFSSGSLKSINHSTVYPELRFIFKCLTDQNVDLKIERTISAMPSDFNKRVLETIKTIQSKEKYEVFFKRLVNELNNSSYNPPFTYSYSFDVPSKREVTDFLTSFPKNYNSHLEQLKELILSELIRRPVKTRLKWMLPQWLHPSKVTSRKVHLEQHCTSYQIKNKKGKFTDSEVDINIKSPQWSILHHKHQVAPRIGRGFTENLNKPYTPQRTITWNKKEIVIENERQLNDLLAHPQSKTNVCFKEYSAAEDQIIINSKDGLQTFIVKRDNANWDMQNAEYEGCKDNAANGITSFTFQQNESNLDPGCKSSKVTITVPQYLKDFLLKKIDQASYYYKIISNPDLFRNVLHELKNIHPNDFKLEINKLYGQIIFLKDNDYATEFPFQSAA